MAKKKESGEILGIPYNFKRPSLSRILKAYWKPGEGMLVRKPFGIGYTLNLASWRSWVVLAVAGLLWWHERESGRSAALPGKEEPVEVIVDED